MTTYAIFGVPAEKQAPSTSSFRSYVFQENRKGNLIILSIMLVGFIVFKLLYPYPDFFSDSYSYIQAAALHLNVNIWPIGYSWFLSLFHWFTHSGYALNLFQYGTWGISALYFYRTVTYFYYTGTNTRLILRIFLFFNPLWLYVANYVSTEMMFVTMSTIWLTQLIWILNRPRLSHLLVQAIFMFFLFTFRYNAMIYPVISAGVFLLCKQKLWIKLAGALSGPALIIPFIIWSSQAAKELTGTAQFPPILGGWQWGNNALYIRGFIEMDSTSFPTPETAELDRLARKYFSKPSRPQNQLASYVTNYFFREPGSPLKRYLAIHYQPKTEKEVVEAWGKAAVVFDRYGKFVVKNNPISFSRYYLLINTKNYFIPPLEKLEVYHMGDLQMWEIGQAWFQYKNPNLWCISSTFQGTLLGAFPLFFLMLNAYYLFQLISFLHKGLLKTINRSVRLTIIATAALLSLNAAFSIFANIIVFRYQLFPMVSLLSSATLLVDYLELLSSKKPVNNRLKQEVNPVL